MNFSSGFNPLRAFTPPVDSMANAALDAIQWTHRLGALVLLTVASGLCVTLRKTRLWRWAIFLIGLLLVQIALGAGNVIWSRPLLVGVMHSATGALILITITFINFGLHAARQRD
jgi:cytochrome c oxidase assembly protein subunit 15